MFVNVSEGQRAPLQDGHLSDKLDTQHGGLQSSVVMSHRLGVFDELSLIYRGIRLSKLLYPLHTSQLRLSLFF